MKTTVTEIKNNTAFVDVILTEKEVNEEKEHAVDELISSVTVKGFRQGKAPKAIAADHIDPEKLSNHILNHVLNHSVSQVVKENKFRLLGRPVLEKIDSKGNSGWTIKISFPLYPEIKVDNLEKILGKSKPAKTTKDTKKAKETKDTKETEDEKMNKIYQTLLEKIPVEVPPSVIEEEANYSIERLETQAKTLNLTLENYLKAVKKTLESVKEEYSKRAEESIKLDLILLEIAKQNKIDTPIEEVKEIAKSGGVPETQLIQLKQIIDRRKTVELLLKV